MIAGEITAIHTNVTIAEFEQWKANALNTLSILQKTTHTKYNATIPLHYIEMPNYLYISLRFFFNAKSMVNTDNYYNWIELNRVDYEDLGHDIVISIVDAKEFISTCNSILPLIFIDDHVSVSQLSGYNPAVGQAIEIMHVYNYPAFRFLHGSLKGIVSTIVATISFYEHRIVISHLIECVKENKFSPEILPEYLQLSFKREFNFPWTGQPVNSQLLIDFLLHCHYKPFLIQFTHKQESTS